MSAKLVISLALLLSGGAILAALASVGLIYSDINDFSDGVMGEMGEFKVWNSSG